MPDDVRFLEQKLLEQAAELEILRAARGGGPEGARDQLMRLRALADAGTVVNSTLDLGQVLKLVMELAARSLRAEAASVLLRDPATGDLLFEVATGVSDAEMRALRVPRGQGIAGHVAETAEGVLVPDCSRDARFFRGADEKTRKVTRNLVAAPLIARGETIGVVEVINRREGTFDDGDLLLLSALGHQSAVAIQNARLFHDVQAGFVSTVKALAQAVDAKDSYTAGHSGRVAGYSVLIAEELGFDEAATRRVRLAGLLHDVGKIGVRDSVLGKPGKLTDEEFAVMKGHPSLGGVILEPVAQLADVIPGIVSHHERFDGRGYPRGLKGGDIPLLGRIIAVADAFDAMTSNRVYRPRLADEVAFGELERNRDIQFDGRMVDAFIRASAKGLVVTEPPPAASAPGPDTHA